MQKICHIVIFEYYHEGYSYQENLLSQKHKELGYDVSIIAAEDDGQESSRGQVLKVGKYINNYGIDVHVLPRTKHNPHLRRFFYKCSGLYDELCSISPEVIFVHNFRAWDVKDIAKYVKKNPKVKLFVDCHDDYYNFPQNSLSNKLEAFEHRLQAKVLLPYTLKFWGTIPWRVEFLKHIYHIPAYEVDLLIMGADETKILGRDRMQIRTDIRNEFSIPQEAFLIVTGGRIDKRKQQDLLMEAVRQLGDKNIYLLAFGTPSNDMVEKCREYGNCRNIIQTGWLPSDRAYDLFIAADLAFFPGTHSVLWEQAAACATPIVVKYWEWITHIKINENAILMKEVTVDTIKNTILQLTNSEHYQLMLNDAAVVAPSFFLKEIAQKSING